MKSKTIKAICSIGILPLIMLFLLISTRYADAAEVTETYPNNIDSSLQGMFDRLCDGAEAGDTINMLIAPGEYREQIFTLCNKPINVRIKGAGVEATRFIANKIQTKFRNYRNDPEMFIQSKLQFGGMISCVRAVTYHRPDGSDLCELALPSGDPYFFEEICLAMKERLKQVDQPNPYKYTPYNTFCEVSDLKVEALGKEDFFNIFRFGIQGNWNRIEVSDVAVKNFDHAQILCPNCQKPEIHHAQVECPTKVPTIDNPANFLQPRPWGVEVITNAATNPSPICNENTQECDNSGTNIHHVNISNCATGIYLDRLPDGSVTQNKISDNFRGISGLNLKKMLFAHNQMVRSENQSSSTGAEIPGWGMVFSNLTASSIIHNSFFDNFIAMEFKSSNNNQIEHNLDFGNGTFIIPGGNSDEFTVSPDGEPQGW